MSVANVNVKERPILFSGPMVRAILESRKTQTRRVVNCDTLNVVTRGRVRGDFIFSSTKCNGKTKGQIGQHGAVCGKATNGEWLGLKPEEFDFCCPYCSGKTHLLDDRRWMIVPDAGQRLWVRECWGRATILRPLDINNVKYRAGNEADDAQRWRPSIHMPRWASRITLEIVSVRVERLQDISEADAIAEGIRKVTKDGKVVKYCVYDLKDHSGTPWADMPRSAVSAYRYLWESINGPGSWDANPWVWVIEFKRIKT